MFGNPPERYRLRLKVASLREHGETLETATEHRLEVTLPKGKSPLNGRAAQWVDENRHRIPIDPEEFFVDLSQAPPPAKAHATPACSNCGARGGVLTRCSAARDSCEDCTLRCPTCGRALCLSCGERACASCAPVAADAAATEA